MAKLPDASVLSQPRFDPGGITPRASVDGIGRGQMFAARALRGVGEDISRMGARFGADAERQRAADERLEVARANADVMRDTINIESGVKSETDPDKLTGRYDEAKTSVATAAQGIKDERTRELFVLGNTGKVESIKAQSEHRRFELIKGREMQGDVDRINDLRDKALAEADPEIRSQLIGSAQEIISGWRGKGYIDEGTEISKRREFAEGYATQKFAMLPPADRVRVLGGFEQNLIRRESSGDHRKINSDGFAGLYQFGAPRLAHLGIYTPGQGEDVKNWKGTAPSAKWTGTFNIPGHADIRTFKDFLESPQAQKAAFGLQVKKADEEITSLGMDKFIGQTVGGVPITLDGLRAMIHLGGPSGAKEFLESGGRINRTDAGGTSIADYGRLGMASGGDTGGGLAGRTLGAYLKQGGTTVSAPKDVDPVAGQMWSENASVLKGQGIDLKVSSTYRDPAHNAAVGGARGSQHLKGKALDIPLAGFSEPQQQAIVSQFLSDPRVRGFGYYPPSKTSGGSIHVDVRDGNGRAAWGSDYTKASVGEGWPAWLTKQVADWQAGKQTASGLIEPGNIDLSNRSQVKNDDGSISTVRSMSFRDDSGREILIPTAADDGSRILSDDEAIQQYKLTGRHLGIFDTPGNATAYAKRLSGDEAQRVKTAQAQNPDEQTMTDYAQLGVRSSDSDYVRFIPESKRHQMLQQAEREFVAQNAHQRTSVATLITDDLASIEKRGEGLPEDKLNRSMIASVKGEQAALEWEESRERSRRVFNSLSGIEFLSEADVERRLATLEPQAGSPGFAAENQTYEKARKRADEFLKARRADPALAVEAFPTVKEARQNAVMLGTAENRRMSPESAQAIIRARLAAQGEIGITEPMAVTRSEARQIARGLRLIGTDDDEGIERFNRTLRATYGDLAPEVLAATLQHAEVNRDLSIVATEIMQSLADGQKPSLSTAKKFDTQSSVGAMESAMKGQLLPDPSGGSMSVEGFHVPELPSQAAQPTPRANITPPNGPTATLDPADIKLLDQNRDRTTEFDLKYGAGSSKKVLEELDRRRAAGATMPRRGSQPAQAAQ